MAGFDFELNLNLNYDGNGLETLIENLGKARDKTIELSEASAKAGDSVHKYRSEQERIIADAYNSARKELMAIQEARISSVLNGKNDSFYWRGRDVTTDQGTLDKGVVYSILNRVRNLEQTYSKELGGSALNDSIKGISQNIKDQFKTLGMDFEGFVAKTRGVFERAYNVNFRGRDNIVRGFSDISNIVSRDRSVSNELQRLGLKINPNDMGGLTNAVLGRIINVARRPEFVSRMASEDILDKNNGYMNSLRIRNAFSTERSRKMVDAMGIVDSKSAAKIQYVAPEQLTRKISSAEAGESATHLGANYLSDNALVRLSSLLGNNSKAAEIAIRAGIANRPTSGKNAGLFHLNRNITLDQVAGAGGFMDLLLREFQAKAEDSIPGAVRKEFREPNLFTTLDTIARGRFFRSSNSEYLAAYNKLDEFLEEILSEKATGKRTENFLTRKRSEMDPVVFTDKNSSQIIKPGHIKIVPLRRKDKYSIPGETLLDRLDSLDAIVLDKRIVAQETQETNARPKEMYVTQKISPFNWQHKILTKSGEKAPTVLDRIRSAIDNPLEPRQNQIKDDWFNMEESQFTRLLNEALVANGQQPLQARKRNDIFKFIDLVGMQEADRNGIIKQLITDREALGYTFAGSHGLGESGAFRLIRNAEADMVSKYATDKVRSIYAAMGYSDKDMQEKGLLEPYKNILTGGFNLTSTSMNRTQRNKAMDAANKLHTPSSFMFTIDPTSEAFKNGEFVVIDSSTGERQWEDRRSQLYGPNPTKSREVWDGLISLSTALGGYNGQSGQMRGGNAGKGSAFFLDDPVAYLRNAGISTMSVVGGKGTVDYDITGKQILGVIDSSFLKDLDSIKKQATVINDAGEKVVDPKIMSDIIKAQFSAFGMNMIRDYSNLKQTDNIGAQLGRQIMPDPIQAARQYKLLQEKYQAMMNGDANLIYKTLYENSKQENSHLFDGNNDAAPFDPRVRKDINNWYHSKQTEIVRGMRPLIDFAEKGGYDQTAIMSNNIFREFQQNGWDPETINNSKGVINNSDRRDKYIQSFIDWAFGNKSKGIKGGLSEEEINSLGIKQDRSGFTDKVISGLLSNTAFYDGKTGEKLSDIFYSSSDYSFATSYRNPGQTGEYVTAMNTYGLLNGYLNRMGDFGKRGSFYNPNQLAEMSGGDFDGDITKVIGVRGLDIDTLMADLGLKNYNRVERAKFASLFTTLNKAGTNFKFTDVYGDRLRELITEGGIPLPLFPSDEGEEIFPFSDERLKAYQDLLTGTSSTLSSLKTAAKIDEALSRIKMNPKTKASISMFQQGTQSEAKTRTDAVDDVLDYVYREVGVARMMGGASNVAAKGAAQFMNQILNGANYEEILKAQLRGNIAYDIASTNFKKENTPSKLDTQIFSRQGNVSSRYIDLLQNAKLVEIDNGTERKGKNGVTFHLYGKDGTKEYDTDAIRVAEKNGIRYENPRILAFSDGTALDLSYLRNGSSGPRKRGVFGYDDSLSFLQTTSWTASDFDPMLGASIAWIKNPQAQSEELEKIKDAQRSAIQTSPIFARNARKNNWKKYSMFSEEETAPIMDFMIGWSDFLAESAYGKKIGLSEKEVNSGLAQLASVETIIRNAAQRKWESISGGGVKSELWSWKDPNDETKLVFGGASKKKKQEEADVAAGLPKREYTNLGSGAAEVWKWTDDNGNIVFGSRAQKAQQEWNDTQAGKGPGTQDAREFSRWGVTQFENAAKANIGWFSAASMLGINGIGNMGTETRDFAKNLQNFITSSRATISEDRLATLNDILVKLRSDELSAGDIGYGFDPSKLSREEKQAYIDFKRMYAINSLKAGRGEISLLGYNDQTDIGLRIPGMAGAIQNAFIDFEEVRKNAISRANKHNVNLKEGEEALDPNAEAAKALNQDKMMEIFRQRGLSDEAARILGVKGITNIEGLKSLSETELMRIAEASRRFYIPYGSNMDFNTDEAQEIFLALDSSLSKFATSADVARKASDELSKATQTRKDAEEKLEKAIASGTEEEKKKAQAEVDRAKKVEEDYQSIVNKTNAPVSGNDYQHAMKNEAIRQMLTDELAGYTKRFNNIIAPFEGQTIIKGPDNGPNPIPLQEKRVDYASFTSRARQAVQEAQALIAEDPYDERNKQLFGQARAILDNADNAYAIESKRYISGMLGGEYKFFEPSSIDAFNLERAKNINAMFGERGLFNIAETLPKDLLQQMMETAYTGEGKAFAAKALSDIKVTSADGTILSGTKTSTEALDDMLKDIQSKREDYRKEYFEKLQNADELKTLMNFDAARGTQLGTINPIDAASISDDQLNAYLRYRFGDAYTAAENYKNIIGSIQDQFSYIDKDGTKQMLTEKEAMDIFNRRQDIAYNNLIGSNTYALTGQQFAPDFTMQAEDLTITLQHSLEQNIQAIKDQLKVPEISTSTKKSLTDQLKACEEQLANTTVDNITNGLKIVYNAQQISKQLQQRSMHANAEFANDSLATKNMDMFGMMAGFNTAGMLGRRIIGMQLGNYQQAMGADRAEVNSIMSKYMKQESDGKGGFRTVQGPITNQADVNRINELNTRLVENQLQVERLQQSYSNLGAVMVGAFAKAGQAVSRFATRMVRQAFTEAKKFAKEFDAAMINIQAITLSSDKEMERIRSNAISQAKELKTSITTITKIQEELYRQGLSNGDVDKRTELIAKYNKVTGGDITSSIKSITAAINSGLVNSVEHAIDTLVALGDTAATTAKEITKGMQKSAAAANNAGVSFEELSVLLTLGTARTQLGGSQVGRALNTLFTRFRKVTSSSGSTDSEGGTASINDVEQALSAVNIRIRDSFNSFRSFTDIMLDLAGVWNDLSDVQKSNITYTMAGTTQGNIFQSILEGIAEDGGEEYRRLLEAAEDSDGITDKKYEIQTKSINTSITELKTSFDSLIESTSWLTKTIVFGVETIQSLFDSLSNNSISSGLGLLGLATMTVSPYFAIGSIAAALIASSIEGIIEDNKTSTKAKKENEALTSNVTAANSIYDKINTTITNAESILNEKNEEDKVIDVTTETEYNYLSSILNELSGKFPEIGSSLDLATASVKEFKEALDKATEANKKNVTNAYINTMRRINLNEVDSSNSIYEYEKPAYASDIEANILGGIEPLSSSGGADYYRTKEGNSNLVERFLKYVKSIYGDSYDKDAFEVVTTRLNYGYNMADLSSASSGISQEEYARAREFYILAEDFFRPYYEAFNNGNLLVSGSSDLSALYANNMATAKTLVEDKLNLYNELLSDIGLDDVLPDLVTMFIDQFGYDITKWSPDELNENIKSFMEEKIFTPLSKGITTEQLTARFSEPKYIDSNGNIHYSTDVEDVANIKRSYLKQQQYDTTVSFKEGLTDILSNNTAIDSSEYKNVEGAKAAIENIKSSSDLYVNTIKTLNESSRLMTEAIEEVNNDISNEDSITTSILSDIKNAENNIINLKNSLQENISYKDQAAAELNAAKEELRNFRSIKNKIKEANKEREYAETFSLNYEKTYGISIEDEDIDGLTYTLDNLNQRKEYLIEAIKTAEKGEISAKDLPKLIDEYNKLQSEFLRVQGDMELNVNWAMEYELGSGFDINAATDEANRLSEKLKTANTKMHAAEDAYLNTDLSSLSPLDEKIKNNTKQLAELLIKHYGDKIRKDEDTGEYIMADITAAMEKHNMDEDWWTWNKTRNNYDRNTYAGEEWVMGNLFYDIIPDLETQRENALYAIIGVAEEEYYSAVFERDSIYKQWKEIQDKIDIYNNKYKTKKDKLQAELDSLSAQKAEVQLKIDAATYNGESSDSLKEELNNINSEIKYTEERISSYDKATSSLSVSAYLDSEIGQYAGRDVDEVNEELKAKVEAAQQRYEEAVQIVSNIESSIAEAEESIAILYLELNGSLSNQNNNENRLRQIISYSEDELASLREEAARASDEYNSLETDLATAEQTLVDYEANNAKLDEYTNSLIKMINGEEDISIKKLQEWIDGVKSSGLKYNEAIIDYVQNYIDKMAELEEQLGLSDEELAGPLSQLYDIRTGKRIDKTAQSYLNNSNGSFNFTEQQNKKNFVNYLKQFDSLTEFYAAMMDDQSKLENFASYISSETFSDAAAAVEAGTSSYQDLINTMIDSANSIKESSLYASDYINKITELDRNKLIADKIASGNYTAQDEAAFYEMTGYTAGTLNRSNLMAAAASLSSQYSSEKNTILKTNGIALIQDMIGAANGVGFNISNWNENTTFEQMLSDLANAGVDISTFRNTYSLLQAQGLTMSGLTRQITNTVRYDENNNPYLMDYANTESNPQRYYTEDDIDETTGTVLHKGGSFYGMVAKQVDGTNYYYNSNNNIGYRAIEWDANGNPISYIERSNTSVLTPQKDESGYYYTDKQNNKVRLYQNENGYYTDDNGTEYIGSKVEGTDEIAFLVAKNNTITSDNEEFDNIQLQMVEQELGQMYTGAYIAARYNTTYDSTKDEYDALIRTIYGNSTDYTNQATASIENVLSSYSDYAAISSKIYNDPAMMEYLRNSEDLQKIMYQLSVGAIDSATAFEMFEQVLGKTAEATEKFSSSVRSLSKEFKNVQWYIDNDSTWSLEDKNTVAKLLGYDSWEDAETFGITIPKAKIAIESIQLANAEKIMTNLNDAVTTSFKNTFGDVLTLDNVSITGSEEKTMAAYSTEAAFRAIGMDAETAKYYAEQSAQGFDITIRIESAMGEEEIVTEDENGVITATPGTQTGKRFTTTNVTAAGVKKENYQSEYVTALEDAFDYLLSSNEKDKNKAPAAIQKALDNLETQNYNYNTAGHWMSKLQNGTITEDELGQLASYLGVDTRLIRGNYAAAESRFNIKTNEINEMNAEAEAEAYKSIAEASEKAGYNIAQFGVEEGNAVDLAEAILSSTGEIPADVKAAAEAAKQFGSSLDNAKTNAEQLASAIAKSSDSIDLEKVKQEIQSYVTTAGATMEGLNDKIAANDAWTSVITSSTEACRIIALYKDGIISADEAMKQLAITTSSLSLSRSAEAKDVLDTFNSGLNTALGGSKVTDANIRDIVQGRATNLIEGYTDENGLWRPGLSTTDASLLSAMYTENQYLKGLTDRTMTDDEWMTNYYKYLAQNASNSYLSTLGPNASSTSTKYSDSIFSMYNSMLQGNSDWMTSAGTIASDYGKFLSYQEIINKVKTTGGTSGLSDTEASLLKEAEKYFGVKWNDANIDSVMNSSAQMFTSIFSAMNSALGDYAVIITDYINGQAEIVKTDTLNATSITSTEDAARNAVGQSNIDSWMEASIMFGEIQDPSKYGLGENKTALDLYNRYKNATTEVERNSIMKEGFGLTSSSKNGLTSWAKEATDAEADEYAALIAAGDYSGAMEYEKNHPGAKEKAGKLYGSDFVNLGNYGASQENKDYITSEAYKNREKNKYIQKYNNGASYTLTSLFNLSDLVGTTASNIYSDGTEGYSAAEIKDINKFAEQFSEYSYYKNIKDKLDKGETVAPELKSAMEKFFGSEYGTDELEQTVSDYAAAMTDAYTLLTTLFGEKWVEAVKNAVAANVSNRENEISKNAEEAVSYSVETQALLDEAVTKALAGDMSGLEGLRNNTEVGKTVSTLLAEYNAGKIGQSEFEYQARQLTTEGKTLGVSYGATRANAEALYALIQEANTTGDWSKVFAYENTTPGSIAALSSYYGSEVADLTKLGADRTDADWIIANAGRNYRRNNVNDAMTRGLMSTELGNFILSTIDLETTYSEDQAAKISESMSSYLGNAKTANDTMAKINNVRASKGTELYLKNLQEYTGRSDIYDVAQLETLFEQQAAQETTSATKSLRDIRTIWDSLSEEDKKKYFGFSDEETFNSTYGNYSGYYLTPEEQAMQAGAYEYTDTVYQDQLYKILSGSSSKEEALASIDANSELKAWISTNEDAKNVIKDLNNSQATLNETTTRYGKILKRDKASLSQYNLEFEKMRETLKNVKYFLDKKTYNKNKDDKDSDLSELSSITGLDEQTLIDMDDEDIRKLVQDKFNILADEYETKLEELNQTIGVGSFATGLNSNGMMEYSIGGISLVAEKVETVGIDDAIAMAQALGQDAIYQELTALKGMGGEVTLETWVDKDGNLHAMYNGVDLTGATGSKSKSSSGGGGKSATDKLLEKWKNRIAVNQHRINMLDKTAEGYKNKGELTNYGSVLSYKGEELLALKSEYEQANEELKKLYATTSKGTKNNDAEDAIKLRDQIKTIV